MKVQKVHERRKAQRKDEAEQCAASFWAAQVICGGCILQGVCPLNTWFREDRTKYPEGHELHTTPK